jgi:hypothetical protein
MRLAARGEVSRRADITDPDAGASEGKVVCVHIPLISNERSVFLSWGLDGNTSSMVMRPGTAAYLDVRKPHAAVNMGDTPRIHLVVDCYANDATVEMLSNATPAPLDESTEVPGTPSRALWLPSGGARTSSIGHSRRLPSRGWPTPSRR